MEPIQYVEALGRTLGRTMEFSPGQDVVARLGGRTVRIRWAEALGGFILAGEIVATSEIPPSVVTMMLRRLLAANHFFCRTAGAALSLDPKGETVWLNRFVSVRELDGVGFIRAVNAFLSELSAWRDRWLAFAASSEERLNADQKRLFEEDMVRISVPDLPVPASGVHREEHRQ